MTLDKTQVVAAAVALLDESGLDGLTLRKLAQRLDVKAPTLYWHIANKAALVNEVAEVILGAEVAELAPPGPDESWQEWLIGVAQRLRRAMLAHPDGARVVSAAHMSLQMAAVSELAMRTLVEHGLPLRQARLTVLTVQHVTVGHVLAEQAPPPDEHAVKAFDMDAFATRHPTVVAGITDYFQDGSTVDDLFRDSLEIILS
jgi:TetR/AcrR family tetracycline transcriptional repressor